MTKTHRNQTSAFFIVLAASLLFVSRCDAPKNEIRIGFVGDILLDRGVRQAISKKGEEDFFNQIDSHLDDYDFLIGNLECPLTEHVSPAYKTFVFRGDPEHAEQLKALGFTHLSLANNHSYDQGKEGMKQTAAALANAGVVPMGYASTQGTSCEPIVISKNEVEIVIFSSVTLALENWFPIDSAPGMCQEKGNSLINRIEQYRRTHSKSNIIVFLHWGIEHMTERSPQQRQLGHALIDAGADAIVGHHPHVIQPTEYYKKKPIAYSVGNFIFDQADSINSSALLFEVMLSNNELRHVEHKYRIVDCIPRKASD